MSNCDGLGCATSSRRFRVKASAVCHFPKRASLTGSEQSVKWFCLLGSGEINTWREWKGKPSVCVIFSYYSSTWTFFVLSYFTVTILSFSEMALRQSCIVDSNAPTTQDVENTFVQNRLHPDITAPSYYNRWYQSAHSSIFFTYLSLISRSLWFASSSRGKPPKICCMNFAKSGSNC